MKISRSSSTKFQFYCKVNPELENTKLKAVINELQRMSWFSFRLSAHSLATEDGVWNRSGKEKLPIEEGLCQYKLNNVRYLNIYERDTIFQLWKT